MHVWPDELDEMPLEMVQWMTQHLLDWVSDPEKWLTAAPFGGEYSPHPDELPPGYADLPVEE